MKTSDIQHNILTIDLTEDQLTAEPTEMSPDMMVSSSSSSSSSSNSSSKHIRDQENKLFAVRIRCNIAMLMFYWFKVDTPCQ